MFHNSLRLVGAKISLMHQFALYPYRQFHNQRAAKHFRLSLCIQSRESLCNTTMYTDLSYTYLQHANKAYIVHVSIFLFPKCFIYQLDIATKKMLIEWGVLLVYTLGVYIECAVHIVGHHLATKVL